MGGDRAPAAILKGCWEAAPLIDQSDSILLVGDENVIRPAFDSASLDSKRSLYQIIATRDVIAMDDPPVEAIRAKPNSSISVMCKLVAKGEADVAISAGNTGACVAAAQLRMRTLPGVARTGIAVSIPTFYGPVVICDAGANISPKPKHLQQYAIMAGAYARAISGKDNPRVGLLSIGEEDAKGTTIVKESRKLMKDEPLINFVGNVEGRDIFKGIVDVVVCDGFVGNIVLKLAEGMAEGLFQSILSMFRQAEPTLLDRAQAVLKDLRDKYDWQEAGGAPLLGVNGYCIICHGKSDSKAIKNAIRVGKQLVSSDINHKIVEQIEKCIPVNEE